ncbi:MAG: V-type ATPase subunit [Candidatus Omnitrophica bacterium]|nr:V-type ATPase subunit [Candidatus Omnitrophota bacterium]
MKTKISILNYAFSVGKIRALEKFLISQDIFQKAVEANLNDALRIFVEFGRYSEKLLFIKDSADLERVLNQESLNLKLLIKNLILDKGLFPILELDNLKEILEIVNTYGSSYLVEYFRYVIDMHNLKTFLRLYVTKEPEEKLKMNLVCGGFIKKEDFLKLYHQQISSLLRRLEYVYQKTRIVDYTHFFAEAIKKVFQENSFIALERAIQDFLIGVLKPAKYITFGPEPVLAYYFAKTNEINLIRMIILAKLNQFPEVLLKERLNSVYAAR